MKKYCQIVPAQDESEWVKEQKRKGFKFIENHCQTSILGWKIITGTRNVEFKGHPENMLNSKDPEDPYLIWYKRKDDPTPWIQEGKPYMQEDGKDLFFVEMLDAINYLASHGNWYVSQVISGGSTKFGSYVGIQSILMAKD